MIFSKDGYSLIAGNTDGSIKVWENENWTLTKTFKGHSGAVTSLA